jgi:hypothetical protein
MPFSVRPSRRFPVCCPVIYQVGDFEGHGTVWNHLFIRVVTFRRSLLGNSTGQIPMVREEGSADSCVGVRLDRGILRRKLLPSRPPHNGFRHFNVLLIRERDGQRERFPLAQGHMT